MRQAVCQHAERAAEKLRGEHQYCRHISAFIKTSPFAINEPYYGNLATEKLMTPTGRFTARTRRQRHHPALTSFKQ
jgi:DNA polymerase V